MKSIILVVACLSMATNGFSQFTRGDKLLVGGLSVQTDKRTNVSTIGSINEYNNYSVTPAIGFFVNEKTAFGVKLGYGNTFSKYFVPGASNSERNYNEFYGGLMIRRYYLISEKFFFLIEGSLGYAKGEINNTFNDYNNAIYNKVESTTDEFSAAILPRFVFFPSPKWGFEAGIGSIGYSNTSNSESKGSISQFNLNYGIFSLGFAYYIRKQN
jgi:hypothetical protein